MGELLLDRRLLAQILAPPPKLLFRDQQLSRARELVGERASFIVLGSVGTGKTTLARMAVQGLEGVVYVDCGASRTYQSLRRKLAAGGALYILDDYSLALRAPALKSLVRSLEPKIVVVHPPLVHEELEGVETVEMPPYTLEELREIVRERVVRLNLPLDDEDVEAAAYQGFRRGGNARVALMTLAHRCALRLRARRWWFKGAL